MSITHRIPGLILTDHEFQVPIDYTQPDGARLTVFAREVVACEQSAGRFAVAGLLSRRARLWLAAPESMRPRPTGSGGP